MDIMSNDFEEQTYASPFGEEQDDDEGSAEEPVDDTRQADDIQDDLDTEYGNSIADGIEDGTSPGKITKT